MANSPDEAKPSQDYEQGWNAINELIRADGTWSGYERNVFYANNGDGTFSDVSGAVGLDFLEDGRAFALADFDHDGRQEVFLKNRNGPQLRLLKNVMEDLPPSIAFRLRGTKSNRDAIGAVVTVETERGPPRRVRCKLDRDFFRSTARMCSSAWEQRRARCARRFAGRADWCRNSTICRSTTGSGLKKGPSHSRWRLSEHQRCEDSSLTRVQPEANATGSRNASHHR